MNIVLIPLSDVATSNVFLYLLFRIAPLQFCAASFCPFTKYRTPHTSPTHPVLICIETYSLHSIYFSAVIPMTARSTTWFFGRSLSAIAGSNPIGCIDVCLL